MDVLYKNRQRLYDVVVVYFTLHNTLEKVIENKLKEIFIIDFLEMRKRLKQDQGSCLLIINWSSTQQNLYQRLKQKQKFIVCVLFLKGNKISQPISSTCLFNIILIILKVSYSNVNKGK